MSLTGRGKQVYTLYRLGRDGSITIGVNHDSGYRGNMGTTLETATANAIQYLSETSRPEMLMIVEGVCNLISRGEVLGFGKCQGMTIAEAHIENPSYMQWVCSQFRSHEAWTSRCADWVKAGIAELDREIFNRRIETNRANSTSEYVGTIGTRQDITLVCTGVCTGCKTYPSNQRGVADTHLFKFTEGGKNIVTCYGEEGKYATGATYTGKATTCDHKEVVGIKTTRINRFTIK